MMEMTVKCETIEEIYSILEMIREDDSRLHRKVRLICQPSPEEWNAGCPLLDIEVRAGHLNVYLEGINGTRINGPFLLEYRTRFDYKKLIEWQSVDPNKINEMLAKQS